LIPSDVASCERRIGPALTTVNSTDTRVGVSPARVAAAVGRRRRESFPSTARSRAAVSVAADRSVVRVRGKVSVLGIVPYLQS